MNREIIFRGKSIGTGEWLYGHLFNWGFQAPSNVPCICVCVPKSWREVYSIYAVHSATIGQCTGLTDKNGKKIYEGDILRLTIPDGSTRHFTIEWANENRLLMPLDGFEHDGNVIRINGWCFNWKGHRLYPSVIDGVPDNERMEVVGNIHDNPDLLEIFRK